MLQYKEHLIPAFLKITFADHWMVNTDRHRGNTNLLFDYVSDEIIPIDHAQGCKLLLTPEGPGILPEAKSLLNSAVTQFPELRKKLLDFQPSWSTLIDSALDAIPGILAEIPSEWGITSEISSHLLRVLSGQEHTQQTISDFNRILRYE